MSKFVPNGNLFLSFLKNILFHNCAFFSHRKKGKNLRLLNWPISLLPAGQETNILIV